MKVLSSTEMQAVSGAGIFDSVMNIFSPVSNVVSSVINSVIDPIAKGFADIIAKGLAAFANILNKELGN